MLDEENPFKPLPNKRYTTLTVPKHCKISGELRLNPFSDMTDKTDTRGRKHTASFECVTSADDNFSLDRTVIISGGAGSGKTLELKNHINDALFNDRHVYLFDANAAVYGDYKHFISLTNGIIISPTGDIKKDIEMIDDNPFVAFDMSDNQNHFNGSNYFLELCQFLQKKHKQAKTKATIVIEEFWQYSRYFSDPRLPPIIELDNLKNKYLNFILSTKYLSLLSSLDDKIKNDFFVIEKQRHKGAFL